MTSEISQSARDKAGYSHALLAVLAFVGIALLAPVLRVIQLLVGA